MLKAKIITARIDEQIVLQIEYLKRHLNVRNTTNVLKEAVANLYKSVKQREEQKSPFKLLEELHLIGCFEGEENLSITYKKELSDSLSKKHQSIKSKKKKSIRKKKAL